MKSIVFWVIFLLFWIGGASYWYVCKVRENCDTFKKVEIIDETKEVSNSPSENKVDIKGFEVNGPDFVLTSKENFYFNYGSSELFIPDDVNDKLRELVNSINNDPHNVLVIDGLFAADEGGAQLGIDRAKELKHHLITQLGAKEDRFRISYDERDNLVFDKKQKTYGAIELSFNKLILDSDEVDKETIENIATTLIQPVNVYFETGSSIMHITPEIHQYVSNLHTVLIRRPDLMVNVIGHTDNTGDINSNYTLSKQRAEEVKKYLDMKRGVPSAQITTSGKGPDKPLDTNDTEEGKALNRRVEIRLDK